MNTEAHRVSIHSKNHHHWQNRHENGDSDASSINLPVLADSPTHTLKSDKLARTPEYIDWRLQVSDSLLAAGYEREAELFEGCVSHPRKKISSAVKDLPLGAETVWVCSEHSAHDAVLFSPTCDLRICPDCAHRQTARFAARYIPKALELQRQAKRGFGLRHIVLTTPYSLEDEDARERYEQLFANVCSTMDLLLGEGWRKNQGFFVSAEFGEDGHKLHAHIIHYGKFIPKDDITEAWRTVTNGECEVNWVNSLVGASEADTANSIIEVVKYSVKFFKVDKQGRMSYVSPELMPKLLAVIKGTRRVRSYGVFYNIGEIERPEFCCEDCGAPMARIGVEHWQIWRNTGFLPHEWKIALGSSLDLTLANKFFDDPPPENKQPLPKQPKLPELDKYKAYPQ